MDDHDKKSFRRLAEAEVQMQYIVEWMGSEERNYTVARSVRTCDFSLKKCLDMFIGRRGGAKSEWEVENKW